jgi:hypothetical protein
MGDDRITLFEGNHWANTILRMRLDLRQLDAQRDVRAYVQASNRKQRKPLALVSGFPSLSSIIRQTEDRPAFPYQSLG